MCVCVCVRACVSGERRSALKRSGTGAFGAAKDRAARGTSRRGDIAETALERPGRGMRKGYIYIYIFIYARRRTPQSQ